MNNQTINRDGKKCGGLIKKLSCKPESVKCHDINTLFINSWMYLSIISGVVLPRFLSVRQIFERKKTALMQVSHRSKVAQLTTTERL